MPPRPTPSSGCSEQNVSSGFAFLDRIAGFDISQRPIEFTAKASTNARAFLVGLINTLIVGVIGIVLATILGFAIGIARLSPNWLVAKIATVYVEFIRNIPLLLQLYFWYSAVLKPLPPPRQSVTFMDSVFLNNRGVYFPSIDLGGAGLAVFARLRRSPSPPRSAWPAGARSARRRPASGRRSDGSPSASSSCCRCSPSSSRAGPVTVRCRS